VAGTILAWGLVVAICAIAVAGTVATAKEAHRRLGGRIPDAAEALLVLLVGVLTFWGGWLLVLVYWLAIRGSALVRRTLAHARS
jgi:hypothetical protein